LNFLTQKQLHFTGKLTPFVKEYYQDAGKWKFLYPSENPMEDKKTFHSRRKTIFRVFQPFFRRYYSENQQIQCYPSNRRNTNSVVYGTLTLINLIALIVLISANTYTGFILDFLYT